MRFWALTKVVGVFSLLFMMLAILASLNPWTAFGIGGLLDSPAGKAALGALLIVLGAAYYKTAFLHGIGTAYEVCGMGYGVQGILILFWGIAEYTEAIPNVPVFHSWQYRLLLLLSFIIPAKVGAAMKKR